MKQKTVQCDRCGKRIKESDFGICSYFILGKFHNSTIEKLRLFLSNNAYKSITCPVCTDMVQHKRENINDMKNASPWWKQFEDEQG